MIKTCPTCKKQFETNYNSKIYCSSRCRLNFNLRKFQNSHQTTYSRTCINCGKEFTTTDSRKIFCSKECYRNDKNLEIGTARVKSKEKISRDLEYNRLRLQHQRAALKLGIPYGQYEAWWQAGLLDRAIKMKEMLT